MTLVETPIVFQDLRDIYRDLSHAVNSPREVRRLFSRYVDLSQRLTSAMRKDFGNGGRNWVASQFGGWSQRTDLLKHLRNQEQHSLQVFLHVNERRTFKLPDSVEVPGFPREFVVDNTWLLTDQLLEEPPIGLEVGLGDLGASPKDAKEQLTPISTTRRYIIVPRNDETKRHLHIAGTADVHEIARTTLETLTDYYEYFVEQAST